MFDPAITPHPPRRRFAAALLADRRGAVAVEFALLAPTLVMFLFGVVDVGALTYEDMQVAGAAHAGALYALHNSSGGAVNLTNVQAAVTGSTGLTVTATPAPTSFTACIIAGLVTSEPSGTTCATGETAETYVQVNAKASVTPIVAWSTIFTPSNITAVAVVRIQ